ncbi:MAG: thrombospondin type 3 repeat-containing protein [Myxococcota bacterium]
MMMIRMIKRSRRNVRLAAVLLAVTMSLGASPALAVDDLAFETDVTDAIDDGLDYLKAQSVFTSAGGSQRQARGLALLALLEKRASADPDADILGYANSSPADQALAEQAVALIMNDTSYGVSRVNFYAYTDGSSLMALSLYARTGGPEVANTNGYTLRSAIDRLVDRVIAAQTNSGLAYDGYWGYTGNGNDSSTTQFAVAGLAAAKGYYLDLGDPGVRLPAIEAALNLSRDGYALNQNADGGHGYRTSGYNSSYQQTASANWVSLLGGADINSAQVQGFLGWLVENYNYETIYAAYNSWTASYYYYLWSSSKSYTLIQDSGVPADPGNLDTESLGSLAGGPISKDRADFRLDHRDFTTDEDARTGGNPGKYSTYLDNLAKPLWYYDYAYTLMTQQDGTGRFTAVGLRNNSTTPINHGCWNIYVCQSYAILVLERALGGACIDGDGDGVCDDVDNCPADPNPEQEDTDGDGVGDACDICPGLDDNLDLDENGIPDCDEVCDVDADGDVDYFDVDAIFEARGSDAIEPFDPMDSNGDGVISVNDGRECVLRCDLENCEEPQGDPGDPTGGGGTTCGLVGLELLPLLGLAGWLRRRREGVR